MAKFSSPAALTTSTFSEVVTTGIRRARWNRKPSRQKIIPDTVATAAHFCARALPRGVVMRTARSTIPRAGAPSIRTVSEYAIHLG
jgi:hypothetical protein